MRFRPAVLLLLFAAPLLSAAPPKLTFSPANPKAGELVMVVADAPAKFKLPDGVIVFNSGDGKGIVFPLPDGGCTVLAAPTDPAPLADVASVEIGRGARPVPPAPVPPGPAPPGPQPLPDGKFGLAKASRDGYAKVTGADKAAGAKALASANRSHASAIAAGGIPAAPATILAEWRKANNAAVDAATWKPWGEAVAAKLSDLYRAGKLPDKAAWVDAFNEIADGLKGD